MDYKITYKYKGEENAELLQGFEHILDAIYQFYKDHEKGCEILKIERY